MNPISSKENWMTSPKYAKENKHAVVIVNNKIEKEIEISVKIDNSSLPMVYVTPENTTPVAFNGKAKIPAQSALVLMEKYYEMNI